MPKDASHDATLPDTSGPNTEPVPRLSDVGIDRRYELGTTLGRGGMGEVRNAKDLRIHREVAVKLLKSATADDDTKARFLREAQVQGALEHPAVPPVHDLGIDRDGQPYFVMKKLAGTTLAEVLDARSSSDALHAKWPRRQLLARLVDVCLAVEFAHTRGIVHRDLKPANIMLGDFGETYVLDWGLARVTNADFPSVPALSGEIEAGHTAVGALLGTPGYMAPEQARGEPVDARTDVYALGCILYEILTGVHALPRGLPAIDATLQALEHRPSKRVEVPPELDDLCARATARDPALRPTARALGEKIQDYLDGDRDDERRRVLAIELAEAATRALDAGADARAEATRLASRALALDPSNATAQAIVGKFMLEAPTEIPEPARAEADHARAVSRQKVMRWAAVTYASVIGLLALMFMFPMKRAWPIVMTMAICAIMAVLFAVLSRRPLPMRSRWFELTLFLNTLALISGAFIFGPLIVVPMFIIGSLAGMVMAQTGHSPAMIVIAHLFAFALPLALELLHLTPSTFVVVDGELVLTPYAVDFTPVGALVVLVLSVVSQFGNTTAIGVSERRTQEEALDRVHAQSWHLKQLLPPTGAGGERSLPAAPDRPPAPPSRDA